MSLSGAGPDGVEEGRYGVEAWPTERQVTQYAEGQVRIAVIREPVGKVSSSPKHASVDARADHNERRGAALENRT